MTPLDDNLKKDVETIERISIIRNLLNVICSTTGMGFAAVARVTEDRWVTCGVRDDIQFGLKPGDQLEIKTTICNEIREDKKAVVIDHVDLDAHFKNHHTPLQYGFQSYISVPIVRKDGSFFGTLCAIDPNPHLLNTPEVLDMFHLFADLISFHIQAVEEVSATNKILIEERILHKTSRRHQLALEAGKLGSFEIEIASGNIDCTAQCKINFGRNPEALFTYNDRMELIFKDDLPAVKKAIQNAIVENIPYDSTYRINTSNGEMRWIRDLGLPVYNEKSVATHVTGVTADITKEKDFTNELEQKVTERTQQLAENNKALEKMNKELQAFAYISSHDLQEPLRKIQTFANIIIEREYQNLTPTGINYFDRMQKAAERMQNLINDLLAYSRSNVSDRKFEKTDLNDVVQEVKLDLMEELQRRNVTIETSNLSEAEIIPFQFRQLLYNLISNSVKFSKPEKQLHIAIKAETGTSEQFPEVKLIENKPYLHVSVSDNGIGFEQKYGDKIFELFQRLHGRETYDGTGIGLAIVKKIVENHEGTITAHSELDKGTIFDIYIPSQLI